MDENASNAYYHIKLHFDIVATYSFIIDKILCIALGYAFSSNIVGYIWEIVAITRCKLSEYYQSRPDIYNLVEKYKALLYLVKIPKDVF